MSRAVRGARQPRTLHSATAGRDATLSFEAGRPDSGGCTAVGAPRCAEPAAPAPTKECVAAAQILRPGPGPPTPDHGVDSGGRGDPWRRGGRPRGRAPREALRSAPPRAPRTGERRGARDGLVPATGETVGPTRLGRSARSLGAPSGPRSLAAGPGCSPRWFRRRPASCFRTLAHSAYGEAGTTSPAGGRSDCRVKRWWAWLHEVSGSRIPDDDTHRCRRPLLWLRAQTRGRGRCRPPLLGYRRARLRGGHGQGVVPVPGGPAGPGRGQLLAAWR